MDYIILILYNILKALRYKAAKLVKIFPEVTVCPSGSIWSAAAIIFFIIELFTTSVIFLCSRSAACGCSSYTAGEAACQLQLFVFAVASVAFFFLLSR
jgi:hypothetical protein